MELLVGLLSFKVTLTFGTTEDINQILVDRFGWIFVVMLNPVNAAATSLSYGDIAKTNVVVLLYI